MIGFVIHPATGMIVCPSLGYVVGKQGRRVGTKQRTGYVRFGASVNGVIVNEQVHRAVWESVNGPIPKGLVINHKNGVKDDNRIENLELVTYSENATHAYQMGLRSNRGSRHPGARLNEQQVISFRNRFANGECPKALAHEAGMNRKYFSRVLRGRDWSHV